MIIKDAEKLASSIFEGVKKGVPSSYNFQEKTNNEEVSQKGCFKNLGRLQGNQQSEKYF